MSNLRRLPSRPRPVEPTGQPFDGKLMEADRTQQRGDHNAAWDCVLDALWMAYRGEREAMSQDRMRHHLRLLAGTEYQPPSAA